MHTFSRLLITISLLALCRHAVHAQWVQTNGPYFNSAVYCLTVAPNETGGKNIFAGTNSGVVLSTDNGASWRMVNTGLENLSVLSLAFHVDGLRRTTLFAGTRDGVFLTTNAGKNWTAANAGIRNRSITCLAVSNSAGGGGVALFGGSYEGAWFSSDNGTCWSKVNSGLENDEVLSLCIAPGAAGAERIFAGTSNNGVFLSTDYGGHWTRESEGLDSGPVRTLAAFPDGAGGINIYAAPGTGLWCYNSNRNNWEMCALRSGFHTKVYSLAASPDETGDTALFAGTAGGVLFSNSKGQNWDFSGLWDASSVCALGVCEDGSGNTNIFAGGVYRGLFISSNAGHTWRKVTYSLANTSVQSLAAIPDGKGGARLIAGTRSMGIHRSTDAGQSWSPMNGAAGGLNQNEWGRSMAFDFNERGISYLLTGLDQWIGRSDDSGKHWVRLSSGLPPYVRILTLDTLSNGIGGTNIYAGTEVHGVYLSTDHGGTWNSTGAGLKDTSVLDLAFLPGGVGGTRILAATEHGVFLSRNNGQSWNAMNNGMGHPAVPAIIVTPQRAGNGRNIFAGTRGTGVFRSTDDGLMWVATGLTNASISAFATVDDGVEGTILFAALADGDGGVFLSTDEGANWSAVSTGLRDIPVLSLCITLDGRGGRDLIAGTNGYGVWRRPLSDMVITDVRPPTNHPAAATLELSVQPNPARDQVLVRYDAGGVTGMLELYNVYGARVLSAEAHAHGIARFDVSQLPAGMYLLLLRSGADVAARRVMVVR